MSCIPNAYWPIIFGLFLVTTLFVSQTDCQRLLEYEQILVVLSFSGLSQDYLKGNFLPYLLQLAESGVMTDVGVQPVFPTKALPNQFSYATGLYTETHGVTADVIYDEKLDRVLNGSRETYQSNPGVLPIWILNEIEGGTSGCMMWPGSEFSYAGRSCTYHVPFDENTSLLEKFTTVQSWLADRRNPPNLIMVYSNELEKISNIYGSHSAEVRRACLDIDDNIRHLLDGAGHWSLRRRINYMILGDHGSASVEMESFLNLTKYLDGIPHNIYGRSAILQVVPEKGQIDTAYQKLKQAQKEVGHFDVFKQNEFPGRWHANHYRAGPILLLAHYGYAFQDMFEIIEEYMDKYGVKDFDYGIFGYDNNITSLYGTFIGIGPYFRKAHRLPYMQAVDVFPLFLHILGLDPTRPNNATDLRQEVLKGVSIAVIAVLITALVALLIGAAVALYFFIPNEGRRDMIVWS
ncbi:unnamed protein product [Hermetia illucens]|uniref:Uncharacterized protein n=2 Tax=Hermetia illucens TaxID=343691 RepID=A0A7R8Z2B1_HERIL|nr:unnamed protein product [Hermetia illucens]